MQNIATPPVLSQDDLAEAVEFTDHTVWPPNGRLWELRVHRHAVELHSVHPSQRPADVESGHRLSRLAGGAALFNLRLCLLHKQIKPVVTLLPRLAPASTLATVRTTGRSTAPPAELAALYACAQHTGAPPLRTEPCESYEQATLVRAAREEQSWLHLLSPEQTGPALELAVPGGSSAAALEFTSAFSPELAVLGSPLGSREADLLAGQALQRVWLTARHFGLSIAVHLLTSHEARSGIRQLIGGGFFPQALLSIEPSAPIPTPRPSAEEEFSSSPRTA
ncbi:hypothetical protein [Saccharopolyspora rectivirgula]|jgi:hypothetical protein|uniref:Nitroreductase n=1 Tax=Saccharopolyspora rectivirgula TaxID=28042 RepID=A0A073BDD8_9PSEU|nr:hypothetical protein [Saccharopolyspora rectivirgula]KEI45784.1 hypothetical protein GU90_02545 [Saccharopolyspora rectivirgula]